MNEIVNWANKKVLVIGGAGFIGINLVKKLDTLGAQITVVDLSSTKLELLPSTVRVISCDAREIENYSNFLKTADFVFLLAARTDLNGKNVDDYRINFEIPKLVLEELKCNQKLSCFIFTSTQLVTGIFNETRFIDEHEPFKTKTYYGQSKIKAEQIINNLCHINNIPYQIIRPTSVYGPYGQEPYRDFFLMIKQGKYFHFGKANNLVSMCFVGNLVEQMLFLARSKQAMGQIFYGNDFHPYTMKEFSEAAGQYFSRKIPSFPDCIVYPIAYFLGIFKILGISVPLYPFRLHNIKANSCYDIGNSIRLGYYPPYDLLDGIKITLDWYINNDPSFQKR